MKVITEAIINGDLIVDDDVSMDVPLLTVYGNIKCHNLFAHDINAYDIDAHDINAYDINAYDINAYDINAHDIDARDIDARDIDAHDIDACNIVCTKRIKKSPSAKTIGYSLTTDRWNRQQHELMPE